MKIVLTIVATLLAVGSTSLAESAQPSNCNSYSVRVETQSGKSLEKLELITLMGVNADGSYQLEKPGKIKTVSIKADGKDSATFCADHVKSHGYFLGFLSSGNYLPISSFLPIPYRIITYKNGIVNHATEGNIIDLRDHFVGEIK